MAIQFQCPHCQAEIRVPDSSAGKRGSCPQCGQKLLVPQPPAPPADAPPVVEVAPPVVEASPQFLSPDAALPPLTPARSVTQQVRRRRTRKSGGWLMPVVCGAVLFGAILWFVWRPAPQLAGQLMATPLESFDVPPVALTADAVKVSRDTFQAVIADLESDPERLRGVVKVGGADQYLSEVSFRGTKSSLEIEIFPGLDAHVYRLDPAQNATLLAWLQAEADGLEAIRAAAVADNAPRFFKAWHDHVENGTEVELARYRDSLAWPARVGGFGYQVEAVARGEAFRCFVEDSEGRLYFFLPAGLKSFELQGRTSAGLKKFPGRYLVKFGAVEKSKKKGNDSRNSRDEPPGLGEMYEKEQAEKMQNEAMDEMAPKKKSP